ncbi:MAG TPA: hypothetical protein VLD18_04815, partial [Verrucomicrobiae bacterium]|nr:hypothetical protein [Verrucomicrobiae bacterium]
MTDSTSRPAVTTAAFNITIRGGFGPTAGEDKAAPSASSSVAVPAGEVSVRGVAGDAPGAGNR